MICDCASILSDSVYPIGYTESGAGSTDRTLTDPRREMCTCVCAELTLPVGEEAYGWLPASNLAGAGAAAQRGAAASRSASGTYEVSSRLRVAYEPASGGG